MICLGEQFKSCEETPSLLQYTCKCDKKLVSVSTWGKRWFITVKTVRAWNSFCCCWLDRPWSICHPWPEHKPWPRHNPCPEHKPWPRHNPWPENEPWPRDNPCSEHTPWPGYNPWISCRMTCHPAWLLPRTKVRRLWSPHHFQLFQVKDFIFSTARKLWGPWCPSHVWLVAIQGFLVSLLFQVKDFHT